MFMRLLLLLQVYIGIASLSRNLKKKSVSCGLKVQKRLQYEFFLQLIFQPELPPSSFKENGAKFVIIIKVRIFYAFGCKS